MPGAFQFADFMTYQQVQPALQYETLGARKIRLFIRVAPVDQFKSNPAIGVRRGRRPAIEIADQWPLKRVGQQVDGAAARVLADTFADDGGDPARAAALILFRQALDISLDCLVDLFLEHADGRPVNEPEQHRGRAAEYQHIEKRQPKCRASQKSGGFHGPELRPESRST